MFRVNKHLVRGFARSVVAVLSIVLSSPGHAATNGTRALAGSADTILRNGAVYTLDAPRSWAQAVAVRDGKIVYVGTDSGVVKLQGNKTKTIDLEGKMLLPGFHDSSAQLADGGILLGRCSLHWTSFTQPAHGAENEDQIITRITDYATKNKSLKWIIGGGWSLPAFPQGNPRKEFLDKLVPDRPAFLLSQDSRSAWVNSRALELANIDRSTKDPPGGRIERDPKTGEPTGTLRDSAIWLVQKIVPEPTEAECLAGARGAMKLANSFGITSVQEVGATEPILKAYQSLDRAGELTVKVVAALATIPSEGPQQVDKLISLRSKYTAGHLRAISSDLFADGAVETHAAAVLKPYIDEMSTEQTGALTLAAEQFNSFVEALDRNRFRILVHAVGDRGVRTALDAFEFARKKNGNHDSRHQISTLLLIDPQDLPRFTRLGVLANFQPFWAHRDKYITDMTIPYLGTERSSRLYPIGSMLNTGALVCTGSCWPESPLAPLDAIQVGVTRCALNDPEGDALDKDQRATLQALLSAYTISGAYANGQDKDTGSIEVGKAADLVVLDRNLFEIPVGDIHKTKVLLTLLDGREVYRNPDFARAP